MSEGIGSRAPYRSGSEFKSIFDALKQVQADLEKQEKDQRRDDVFRESIKKYNGKLRKHLEAEARERERRIAKATEALQKRQEALESSIMQEDVYGRDKQQTRWRHQGKKTEGAH